MKHISIFFIALAILVSAQVSAQQIEKEMSNGNFKKAEELINSKICSDKLTVSERIKFDNLLDQMQRIRLDFRKTEKDIRNILTRYFPNLSDTQISKWEKEKSLEMMIIDGEKRYFNNAVPNLFRINKEANVEKVKIDGVSKNDLNEFLASYLPNAVNKINIVSKLGAPFTVSLKYTVTLNKDAVPEGEIVRCWLPFPREDHSRQTNVRLTGINDSNYVLTTDKKNQRTVYFEKKVKKNEPTIFQVEYQYTSRPQLWGMENVKTAPYKKDSDLYLQYTKEVFPHIVFTDEIKNLASKIKGDETDPYKIVIKIVEWITNNIPWASAREYSTIDNISEYCLANMHGDCGIKSMLFITLARNCGIPAKWQSGWMLHPKSVNMHDWAQVYYEGVGWVGVDPDFGIQKSSDLAVRNFYTNGIDAYRLIVNDDISDELFPAKLFPRSEPVDFQRGELEWRGGNLYFDKWDYHMDVSITK